jgi:hypothetical protein
MGRRFTTTVLVATLVVAGAYQFWPRHDARPGDFAEIVVDKTSSGDDGVSLLAPQTSKPGRQFLASPPRFTLLPELHAQMHDAELESINEQRIRKFASVYRLDENQVAQLQSMLTGHLKRRFEAASDAMAAGATFANVEAALMVSTEETVKQVSGLAPSIDEHDVRALVGGHLDSDTSKAVEQFLKKFPREWAQSIAELKRDVPGITGLPE